MVRQVTVRYRLTISTHVCTKSPVAAAYLSCYVSTRPPMYANIQLPSMGKTMGICGWFDRYIG
jgi:hypothetical protein